MRSQVLLALVLTSIVHAQEITNEELLRRLVALEADNRQLRGDVDAANRRAAQTEEEMQVLVEELEAVRGARRSVDLAPAGNEGTEETAPAGAPVRATAGAGWTQRLTLSGYGETHLNQVEGPGGDLIDNHRFVLYLGYEFADWLQLHSETEIEHSFVEGGHGELSIEQLYTDFLLHDALSIRAGRVLTPLGIINETHEPTTFNGVERPAVETFLIPTTWSTDGVGIFGRIGEAVEYQAYVGSSLDGTAFSATGGIRGGRMKERPGVSEPAVMGRIDVSPLVAAPDDTWGDLRLGISAWAGGLGNHNKGAVADLDAYLWILSTDMDWSIGDFDIRGVFALERIGGAGNINDATGANVAKWLYGYYVEAAYHWLPEAWKTGRLEDADATVFARFDDFDTQAEMPSGFSKDRWGDRTDLTFGLSFFPTSQYVIKADMQISDDETARDLPLRWNLGMGWIF